MALPDIELAAICTAHEETARDSAKRFGVAVAFHDHHEMLRQADVDVVAVSVRVPLHYQLTMDALRAGKHVFTEWPLGANLAEAEEMTALARSQGVLTMVGMQGRAAPAFLWLRELIDEGYVGEVVSCSMVQYRDGILSRTSGSSWQADPSNGATTLTILFGHAIDTLCMCLGEFRAVSATVETRVPQWRETDTGRTVDTTAPDTIVVNGTLENGAVVSVQVSAVPWHSTGYRLEVHGQQGTLVLTTPETSSIFPVRIQGGRSGDSELTDLAIPSHHILVPDSVPEGPPFNVAQMWTRFADGIRKGEAVEPSFDTAVTRHRLLDAVQRASDTGRRQAVSA